MLLIDIHSHILPGIDDGPQSNALFLKMAEMAAQSGIAHLYATPHHLNRNFENTKSKIIAQVKIANEQLAEKNIPLVIHLGQEVRIPHDFFRSLNSDELLTYDNKGMYMLIELPSRDVSTYTFEIIYELLVIGITPIIAHPERNLELLANPDLLYEFVDEGALTQITAGSILGHFGRRVKSYAGQIIEHHLAHFIASDAHNTTSRGFYLQEAYERIRGKYGNRFVEYFETNAEFLLQCRNIEKLEAIPLRKKIMGIF